MFLCETERDLCNCVRFSPCAVREYVCVFSLCVCVSLEGALRCVCVFLSVCRVEGQASLGGGDPEGRGCRAEEGGAEPGGRTAPVPQSTQG